MTDHDRRPEEQEPAYSSPFGPAEDPTKMGSTVWIHRPSKEVLEEDEVKAELYLQALEREEAPDPSDAYTDAELWREARDLFGEGR